MTLIVQSGGLSLRRAGRSPPQPPSFASSTGREPVASQRYGACSGSVRMSVKGRSRRPPSQRAGRLRRCPTVRNCSHSMPCVHSNGLSALNGAGCRSRRRQLDLGELVERSEGRAPARGHFRRRCRRCSRLMGEDDAGTLARFADVAHAMCDVSDELDAARTRSSWEHF